MSNKFGAVTKWWKARACPHDGFSSRMGYSRRTWSCGRCGLSWTGPIGELGDYPPRSSRTPLGRLVYARACLPILSLGRWWSTGKGLRLPWRRREEMNEQ